MRLILWPLYTLIAVLFIWLAIANKHGVTIALDPLPYAIDLPLFFVFMIGVFLGLIILSPINLLTRWRSARRARKSASEISALKKELESANAEKDRLSRLTQSQESLIETAQKVESVAETK